MTRNDEVERWLETAKDRDTDSMRRARDIILAADPRVTETIKWSTPTFAYKGNILSFTPTKKGLGLMFHRGAELPGEHPRLEGDGQHVRTMRFGDADEVESGRKDIERAIRAWCDWRDGEGS